MRRIAIVLAAWFAVFTVFACKDDDEHTHGSASFPVCEEIAEACHELDTGSGKPHECHDLAHDATEEATCTAKRAECLAACPSGDAGGAGSDSGGTGDAATGG